MTQSKFNWAPQVTKDTHDQWWVSCNYWRLRADGQGHAKRIAEIIEGAYKAGREDVASGIRELLGVGHEQR